MSLKKKIVITVALGILVAVGVYGIVLCINNLIDNYSQYLGFKKTHPPDFFWTRILKKNIALLYVLLVILFINFSFIVCNLINFIHNKKLLWFIKSMSKQEKNRLRKEQKKKDLEEQLKKIKKELQEDAS